MSDKTLEVKAKNKNLRQELMILVKTNKILQSRMANGLGTIDESSLDSSMIDDHSMSSFVGYNQSDTNEVSYCPPNNNETINPKISNKSNTELTANVGSPVDMIIETSHAIAHTKMIPESTYSSGTSHLDPVTLNSTAESSESGLILLENNPRVIELTRLLQSRYTINIKRTNIFL